jgi:hypothetical protein
VATLSKELEVKKVVVAQSQKDCEDLLVQIVSERRVADEQRKQVCALCVMCIPPSILQYALNPVSIPTYALNPLPRYNTYKTHLFRWRRTPSASGRRPRSARPYQTTRRRTSP